MTDFLAQLSDYLPLSPLATNIGITCLLAQVAFTILFNKRTKVFPNGPWTHLTAFSAHQVVALPLMIILTYIGWRDWFFDPNKDEEGATAADRIFGYSNSNDIPLAVGTGAILLWDIPMGFISPPLRDPIMWAHHVGMFFVAATISGTFCKSGNMIGYYYSPFYFGVIEMSSIFLSYVDVFHPKYKHYHKWLNAKHSNEKIMALKKLFNNVNEMARIIFALSFLVLRGIYFPYVSFTQAVPDLIKAYENPPDGVPMWTGYFLIGMISSFAFLQAYWGLLIAQQAKKVLTGDSGDKDKKKSGSGKKKD
eukprot:CAMPEP_0201875510 /NCGR_PEP_ID=MMETSP0902-20130614/7470_1 /ASSEMBLY_ACC=CAM_ASM_000551 /TAXON_ID=420261 /ORGANISM="Thalassiosira antarctica, Strain CCMP982" /LENGTH=306 /DNA_ID=CAMNT_0048402581 /DNA_START=44 /DNA_END=964 /DNA_ORIENTATION=-